jgi:hypothetical protein
MRTIKQITFLFLVFISIISCTDDQVILPLGAYERGFFISNEGNFGTDNAEVSFISNDGLIVKQDVFKSENNGAILGNTLQSIAFHQDKAFLVVNGSNKIEVVNRYTFKRIATINTGLNNPRYMVFMNNKGFVTNWGAGSNPNDDYVAVINLLTYTVESTIPVVEGPEKIIAHNNILYVAHQGGWSFNNKVSVITNGNAVSQTLTVGDVPKGLGVFNNQLFVLCAGKSSWQPGGETDGGIHVVNLANNTVALWHTFEGAKPNHMTMANNDIYYSRGNKIFKTSVNDLTFNSQEILDATAQNINILYGMSVSQNMIFVLDAVNYTGSNGKVLFYNKAGSYLGAKETGLLPNGVGFN